MCTSRRPASTMVTDQERLSLVTRQRPKCSGDRWMTGHAPLEDLPLSYLPAITRGETSRGEGEPASSPLKRGFPLVISNFRFRSREAWDLFFFCLNELFPELGWGLVTLLYRVPRDRNEGGFKTRAPCSRYLPAFYFSCYLSKRRTARYVI